MGGPSQPSRCRLPAGACRERANAGLWRSAKGETRRRDHAELARAGRSPHRRTPPCPCPTAPATETVRCVNWRRGYWDSECSHSESQSAGRPSTASGLQLDGRFMPHEVTYGAFHRIQRVITGGAPVPSQPSPACLSYRRRAETTSGTHDSRLTGLGLSLRRIATTTNGSAITPRTDDRRSPRQ